MAEYIERNKAVDAIAHLMATGFVEDRFITPHELQSLQDELETLPAADVAPVVHGYWVLEAEKGPCMDFHVKAHCSECGHKWFGENGVGNYPYVFSAFVRGADEDAIAFVLYEASKIKIDRFCSACGAKMDKEEV